MSHFPTVRMRRLRQHAGIRKLVSETKIDISKLVFPLFIKHGSKIKQPIKSMPGQFQFSVDALSDEINALLDLGITNVVLFGIPEKKDRLGQDAYADNGIIQQAVQKIKHIAPNVVVITDVCFCEYTDQGHCGVIVNETEKKATVDNDATLELLVKQTLSHVAAGADIVAPSGSMDGMVQAIRQALDSAHYQHIPILSYAVKYASSMYGPFRDAAEGKPQFGDRSTYQLDFANANEALRECELDIAEGADMLMVKPAHTYLDIVYKVKQTYPEIPLCAYHTSGEYAMLKAAASAGWIDETKCALEVLTAIKRAGADFIITYFAKDVATYLR